MDRWRPKFTITGEIVSALMTIEAAKAVVGGTVLSPTMIDSLQHEAKVRATHYSTRIEGNRLTLEQAARVLEGAPLGESARERDVLEVKHYWEALDLIEVSAKKDELLTEPLIRRVHGVVERGRRAKATAYRDGQNVIRDSRSGAIIYLPPEATDVPGLMLALVEWVQRSIDDQVPIPIIAALVHYQFVTIHPYYDGNGRTARLLAAFILHRHDYALNGFVSLEEYHARDLTAYNGSLITHPHRNYYEGRQNADLTGWVSYFVALMANVFSEARRSVIELVANEQPQYLSTTDIASSSPQARAVLSLFAKKTSITANQVATRLRLSPRMARVYIAQWVEEGWLVATSQANRNRAYTLNRRIRDDVAK